MTPFINLTFNLRMCLEEFIALKIKSLHMHLHLHLQLFKHF